MQRSHSAGFAVRRRQIAICLLALLVALFPASAPAQSLPPGTTIAVTTFADELTANGQCSLREAVQAANTNAAVDTCPAGSNNLDLINLAAGTYTLSRAGADENNNQTGDLDIYTHLRIAGVGRDQTIIDGGRIDRIFDITYFDGWPITQVTISGVTVRNGFTLSGGAIRNAADLVVENSRLTGNQALLNGSAVYTVNAFTLINSQVTTNVASLISTAFLPDMWPAQHLHPMNWRINQAESLIGGAIVSSDTLTITGSAIDDNIGGGIFNFGGGEMNPAGTATISGSTINRNRNELFSGGGILNFGGTLTLTGSEVRDNYAFGGAGGILALSDGGGAPILASTVTIADSVIADNEASSISSGGGIVVMEGNDPNDQATNAITITNSLIQNNEAGMDGGGIVILDPQALLLLEDSTVSGNRAGTGDTRFSYGGIANAGIATIRNSTISGNQAPANEGHGGGIGNNGTLTMIGGTIHENQAAYAGGLINTHLGTVTLTGVDVAGNTAQYTGGGLRNDGTLTVSGGTIRENQILVDLSKPIDDIARGGGIFNLGTLTVRDNTQISGNTAFLGGGLANTTCVTDALNLPALAILEDSTFSANRSLLWGGAIANEGGLRLSRMTLHANQTFSEYDLNFEDLGEQPQTLLAYGAGLGGAIVNGIERARIGRGLFSWCTATATPPAVWATITESTVSANFAAQGAGGIANYTTMSITATEVLSNTVYNFAGGLYNAGALTIYASRIMENRAEPNPSSDPQQGYQGLAGGLHNDGSLTIRASAVLSNTAGTNGGGLANGATGDSVPFYIKLPPSVIGSARLTLDSTTIAGNQAGQRGGGVFISQVSRIEPMTNSVVTTANSVVTMTNSLVFANQAGQIGGGFDTNANLILTNVTISGNTAADLGGGLNVRDSGVVTATFVTITDNRVTATSPSGLQVANENIFRLGSSILYQGGAGPACHNTPLISLGYNLLSANCAASTTGDQVGVDPLLGPLAANGGPTRTHALLPGSPAIDAGHSATCPATDQRGVARPSDGDSDGQARCDSGAYEAPDPGAATPTPTPTGTPTPGSSSTATPTATPTRTPAAGPEHTVYLPLLRR